MSVAPAGFSVPAGDFELALARPPLPDSLSHNRITYEASPILTADAGSTIRAKVEATLTHAGSSLVYYPRDCVVELVAYRDRDRRDTAPRSGAPDWRESRACAAGEQQVILNRGQSITFASSASPRDVLGASLPEGTYHFAVIVHTRTRDVWLSAGSGDLRR